MTECEDVADNMAINLRRRDIPQTFDEALAIVRQHMPDESHQIQDNIAEALLNRAQYK